MPKEKVHSIVVRLADEEWSSAFKTGLQRYDENKDRPDSHGFTGDPKQIRLDGAVYEMAVRKAGGFPLELVQGDGPDLGDNGHIRGTNRGTASCLLIRPLDVIRYPAGQFILVVGDPMARDFLVVGGLQANLVRLEWLKDWNNGRPSAYGIPWYELNDIDDVFEKIVGARRTYDI